MADGRPLARSDPDDVVRFKAKELLHVASYMDARWGAAGPIEQGELWARMKHCYQELQKALDTVPDPKPGQCAYCWYDVPDALWDRCGLPTHHQGEHKAEYLVKAEKEKAGA